MNTPTNTVHRAVRTEHVMKINGTVSEAADLDDYGIIIGVMIATMRFIIQFKPVAILIALSCIVSAM